MKVLTEKWHACGNDFVWERGVGRVIEGPALAVGEGQFLWHEEGGGLDGGR